MSSDYDFVDASVIFVYISKCIFHDGLYSEECGEEKVEIAEDVNIEQGGLVIFEHQGEGVEDNQEQNKVLKRR